MTTPVELRRLTLRIINSASVAEIRIPQAAHNITLNTADGHPATTQPGNRGGAELTPTESAAHLNLGDIYGYPDTPYNPGPTTLLADVEDALRATLHALDLVHDALTECGIPPFHTHQLKCRGINGQGCPDWADERRTDHLCIDCGRNTDTGRRRRTRHGTQPPAHNA